jgi:outer membrane receptor protein involved in Fe transport
MKYFFYLFLITSQLLAQQGIIKGKIKETKNRLPMRGVNIIIEELKMGSISDETGSFKISDIPSGIYTIKISLIGHAFQERKITITKDEVKTIDFELDTTEISLREVKISASNAHKQNVISSLDIKLRPIENSQDVLRLVPGLVMGQHAGGGKAEQIFLRGFDIDHGTDIHLSVDGMPINMVSHAHGQGYADAHFIIPEMIEGVDFKKGMYDVEKGNFTTAGWANFRTKKALDDNFIKTEIGQFNTFRLVSAANLLKSTNKNNLFLAGEYNYSDSYFDAPQDFQRLNLMSKFHGHISKSTSLTLTYFTFWSKWNASGQIPDRAVADGTISFFGSIDPKEGGQTSRTNLNAEFLTLTKRNHVWKNQMFYSKYDFKLFSNFTFFLEDPINGDQIKQAENRSLWGYNSCYSIGHELAEKQATFTVGLNYRQDLTVNSDLSQTHNRNEIIKRLKYGNINELNFSLFAEESIQLNKKLSMVLGLRYEFFNNQYLDKLENQTKGQNSAQMILPKLNFYYTANKNLQFYLTSGKGFHSNDTRAVVAQNSLQTLPDSYGSDLGTIWKPMKKIVINAAYWYLWLNQEFVYVGDAAVVESSGKTKRTGFDISLRYQLTKFLFFDTDANWAKPRAIGKASGEDFIPLAVKFTIIGGLTLKNKKGLSGSFRYRYIADRPANEDNSIVAKGYFVNDALLNFTKGKFTYGLSIQNIFNVNWRETQFATLTRLKNETNSVNEICFTPGTPFNAKASMLFIF